MSYLKAVQTVSKDFSVLNDKIQALLDANNVSYGDVPDLQTIGFGNGKFLTVMIYIYEKLYLPPKLGFRNIIRRAMVKVPLKPLEGFVVKTRRLTSKKAYSPLDGLYIALSKHIKNRAMPIKEGILILARWRPTKTHKYSLNGVYVMVSKKLNGV